MVYICFNFWYNKYENESYCHARLRSEMVFDPYGNLEFIIRSKFETMFCIYLIGKSNL